MRSCQFLQSRNLLDWTSRLSEPGWVNKPVLLMATSPGGRGGASVLEAAEAYFSCMKMRIVGSFSLPNFYDNFADGYIGKQEKREELIKKLAELKTCL